MTTHSFLGARLSPPCAIRPDIALVRREPEPHPPSLIFVKGTRPSKEGRGECFRKGSIVLGIVCTRPRELRKHGRPLTLAHCVCPKHLCSQHSRRPAGRRHGLRAVRAASDEATSPTCHPTSPHSGPVVAASTYLFKFCTVFPNLSALGSPTQESAHSHKCLSLHVCHQSSFTSGSEVYAS